MKKSDKLSLSAAILINLNIMLGVGLFINTTELAKEAGILGSLSYLTVGILLLPLVLSIVQLLTLYPAGGFYTFGAQAIHPFAGFISSWSYFTAKIASTLLVIHTFVLLMQQIIPRLSSYNSLILDFITLIILSTLNLLNIKKGNIIQMWVMIFKIIPIVFLLFVGVFFIQGSNLTISHSIWPSITATLPLVLYATTGFEAACSLSSKIENAKKNAPRAVLISYGLIIVVYCLYQFIFYGILGSFLAQQTDYRDAFPILLQKIFPTTEYLRSIFITLFHLAIAASALGAGYGMLYSNIWNLYVVAKHDYTFFSDKLCTLNQQQIPFLCIIVEIIICLIYLATTRGNQLSLQKTGAFGITIAYTISVISLLVLEYQRNKGQALWLPVCGLGSCIVLLAACINSFFKTGITDIVLFIGILSFGTFMFWHRTKKSVPSNVTSM